MYMDLKKKTKKNCWTEDEENANCRQLTTEGFTTEHFKILEMQ